MGITQMGIGTSGAMMGSLGVPNNPYNGDYGNGNWHTGPGRGGGGAALHLQAPARAKIRQNLAKVWRNHAKSGKWILGSRAKIWQRSGKHQANGFWTIGQKSGKDQATIGQMDLTSRIHAGRVRIP